MPLHSLLPSSVWLSSAQVWRWFPASAVQGTAVMAYLDCITSVLPLTGGLQASKARHARSDLWLQPLAQHEALLPSAPPARSPHRKGGISSVAALAFSTDAGPRRRGLHHCSHGVFLPSTRCLPHKDVTARASASSASDQPLPSWTPQQQSSEALLTEPGTSTGTESHQDSLGISTQTTKRRSPSPAENPSAAAAAATVPLRDPGEEEAAGQAVDYLSLTDAELLRQCNVDTYRASGPGGQHRNKTESAVRLRHTPTGCVSQSAEQRSQHLNRDTALLRLRQAIALKVRRPVDLATYKASVDVLRILPPSSAKQRLPRGVQSIGPKHPDFHAGVRELLDVLAAKSCSVSEAAAILGVSTAGLSKLITAEKALLQQVNDMRASQGLKPLR